MRVLAFASPNFGLVTIGSGILAILVALAVAIPLSGVRPYGEQAIFWRRSIERIALSATNSGLQLGVQSLQIAACLISPISDRVTGTHCEPIRGCDDGLLWRL